MSLTRIQEDEKMAAAWLADRCSPMGMILEADAFKAEMVLSFHRSICSSFFVYKEAP